MTISIMFCFVFLCFDPFLPINAFFISSPYQYMLLPNTKNHIRSNQSRMHMRHYINQRVQNSFSQIYLNKNDDETNNVDDEVGDLLARAKKIRDSIPVETVKVDTPRKIINEMALQNENDSAPVAPSADYRLYIDIGREEGTWMDKRWGASGERIEFTLDVSFLVKDKDDCNVDNSLADEQVTRCMVKDNLAGDSSPVRRFVTARSARLRQGFYKMPCRGGGYRIDLVKNLNKSSTIRFYVDVEGTNDKGEDNTFGDISIPKGNLFFSLPCFGNSVKQLSLKEGIVTMRAIGWNTGWRREESRIVGVFRAIELSKAKKRDIF